MKAPKEVYLLTVVLMVVCCKPNIPTPPSGWKQRANNAIIGRITIDAAIGNCAETSGRHVICPASDDTLLFACSATITFTDGSPQEKWQLRCEFGVSDTLLFDDGQQTYFYGTKR